MFSREKIRSISFGCRILLTAMTFCFFKSAVAETDTSIENVYVVGVIAEKSKNSSGIVVIKNHDLGESYTIRGGQSIPKLDQWVITSIKRRFVTASNGLEKRELAYGLKNLEGYVANEQSPEPEVTWNAAPQRDWQSARESEYVTEVYRSWMETNKKAIEEFNEQKSLDPIEDAQNSEGNVTNYNPGEFSVKSERYWDNSKYQQYQNGELDYGKQEESNSSSEGGMAGKAESTQFDNYDYDETAEQEYLEGIE